MECIIEYRDKNLKENNRFMAAINDLIAQIQDAELRNKIEQEVNRMNKQKKFGLVFEEHLPECTPLYEMPVNCGSNVALKSGNINDIYRVIAINNEKHYA